MRMTCFTEFTFVDVEEVVGVGAVEVAVLDVVAVEVVAVDTEEAEAVGSVDVV